MSLKKKASSIYHSVSDVEAEHNQIMSRELSEAKLRDKMYGVSMQEHISLGSWHPGKPSSRQFHKDLEAHRTIHQTLNHVSGLMGKTARSVGSATKDVASVAAKKSKKTSYRKIRPG